MTPPHDFDIDAVHRDGWATIRLDPSDVPDLAAWAYRLGQPVPSQRGGPLVDELRVRPVSDAPDRSLSSRHGTGAFPYHTDQAKCPVPPRYVVLRCRRADGHGRPTLLQPLDQLGLDPTAADALRRAVWVVDGGRGRFTSTILSRPCADGPEALRFDPSYMRPAHARFAGAADVLSAALDDRDPVRVEWDEGLAVVFDNWRVLHARAARETSTDAPERRLLERVLLSHTPP